jgi:hypothetical protein
MDPTSDFLPAREGAVLDVSKVQQDAGTRRLRDRYIATRYVQFPEPGIALRHTNDILRWARQLLDDDQPRLATELLYLALEEEPKQRRLWLFLLELAFLNDDATQFNELADEFKRRFVTPDLQSGQGTTEDEKEIVENNKIIDVMGVELAPNDPRYANAGEPTMLPNWSTPDSAERNEAGQRKLHTALTDAIAFHNAPPPVQPVNP